MILFHILLALQFIIIEVVLSGEESQSSPQYNDSEPTERQLHIAVWAADRRLAAADGLNHYMPPLTVAGLAVQLALQELPDVSHRVICMNRVLRLVDDSGSEGRPNGTVSDVWPSDCCSGGSDHSVYVVLKRRTKNWRQTIKIKQNCRPIVKTNTTSAKTVNTIISIIIISIIPSKETTISDRLNATHTRSATKK